MTIDLRLLASKTIHQWRRGGAAAVLGTAVGLLRRNGGADEFDRRHGTDTARVEPLWKFTIGSPHARDGVRYQPTDERDLAASVELLEGGTARYAFVDLGCGKGRALLVAARLGFRRLVGVEFAAELAAIARENLRRVGVANAVVEHADAADFRFPDEDLVVYLYNPFSDAVLRRVADNLRRCASPRLYVVYNLPLHAEVLDACEFLEPMASPAGHNVRLWRRRRERHDAASG
jgi:SAM-dependent methyltransferase